jgi:hypothetical protein
MVAKQVGVTQVYGKALSQGTKTTGKVSITSVAPNIPVATTPFTIQNEPSIAANPMNPKELLAFLIDTSTAFGCSVYYSVDGGSTWTFVGSPAQSPNAIGPGTTDTCYDPVVRFAPDGSVAYLAYESMGTHTTGFTSDIVVTTVVAGVIGAPVVVLFPGLGAFDFWDKPWLDVHQVDLSEAPFVYVTAAYFDITGVNVIGFDVSGNYGTTWTGTAIPLSSALPFSPLVQWPRPIGGTGGMVLACWFNAGPDGLNDGPFFAGVFDIRCRTAFLNGLLWLPEVAAASNVMYELPFFLGPGFNYMRWNTAEAPSIAISPDGKAHVVFTRDPTAARLDSNCGDVMYVSSTPALFYSTWTAPVTIAGGLMAQGFPNIVVQQQAPFPPTPLGYRLLVFYYDFSFSSPPTYPNVRYDVFMRYSNTGGVSWGPATRITEVPSLSMQSGIGLGIGDYFDSSATVRRAWVAWTDRAGSLSVMDPTSDVFADFV